MDTNLIEELARIGLIARLEQIGNQAITEGGTKGFTKEYLEYIKSIEWQERRKRIVPRSCGGCGATDRLELNHKCYPPRGAPLQAYILQPDTDFCWLCHDCHSAITKNNRKKRAIARNSKK